MINNLKESKVLRDPIHGYIHIDLAIIWDLINTSELQRLRRIHQLGGNYQVYHTAEHSRFAHSLGVYEIIRRMVYENEQLNNILNEYEKTIIMIAGLLHDIGHGPFSHAFESVVNESHEVYTIKIIEGNTNINRVLNDFDSRCVKDVVDILLYRYSNPLLNQILSGQLDADRMDYLLRDAYFTGTTYGNFDLERVLRTMRVKDDKLVVKMSGIHTVEDYIMARYHMYWQVYYHPIARSYEGMLMMLFKRMKDVYMVNPIMFNDAKMFIPFINNKDISVEDYLRMDEAAILYGLNILCDSSDKILSDISNRLLNRRLFKYINVDNEDEVLAIKDKVVKLGYDPNYYLYRDHRNQRPYQPYDSEQGHNIWILEDNSIIELSKISVIVRAITSAKMKEENKLFFPID